MTAQTMNDTTAATPARPTFKQMINGVVDAGACSECGSCVVVCPHLIIEMNGRKPAKRPGSEGAHDHCGVSVGIGCDACAAVCPRLGPREPELRDAAFDGDRGWEGIFGVYRQQAAGHVRLVSGRRGRRAVLPRPEAGDDARADSRQRRQLVHLQPEHAGVEAAAEGRRCARVKATDPGSRAEETVPNSIRPRNGFARS